MQCPHCSALCADTDPVCYSCSRSLSSRWVRKLPWALSLVFAVLMMVFILTCTDAPQSLESHDNAEVTATMMTNTLFIGVCGVIGWGLGWVGRLVLRA
jgi:hypothetical protein